MRIRQPAAVAGGLQYDRSHRIRHPLHDDGDLDSAADDFADGVVHGKTVGNVAARAVYVERDRPVVVVGELTKTFDDRPRGLFLDIADQVDIAEAIGLLLSQHTLDGVDQLSDKTIVQFTGWSTLGDLHAVFL